MGDSYSYVGAVVGATYPEQGKILRKVMPKSFILVPGYGAQGGKGADLVHFFNEDGLGAIVNSSQWNHLQHTSRISTRIWASQQRILQMHHARLLRI